MENAIAAVRRFNRFFTRFVGALDADFLDTGLSLAEARLIFEIAQREPCEATGLQAALELDAGFLSRVLRRFEERGWVERQRVDGDGRRRSIALTPAGRALFEMIDGRQRGEVETILARLDAQGRGRLVAALEAAQDLLEARTRPGFTLRPFRQGDMGLLVSRQAMLYHEQFGFNEGIEINEAEVVAAFLRNFKPGREQGWIAEIDGEMAGSVLLTDEGDGLSRLRLLYVEPKFQGRGIGDALVSACLEFARSVGYRRMTLWTHSILESARRIYARHGFEIVSTEEHDSFGPMLLGEIWELGLDSNSR
jgi:DNA-binding MarR family transcriptional regulator/GNAT superfamily N-acetyltransferase